MRKTPLQRRTPLRAAKPLQRVNGPQAPRTGLTMTDALRTAFQAKHPASGRACEVCGQQASQWHHYTPQQHLRAFVLGEARQRDLEPVEVRSLLRTLLRDERNLAALCFQDHQGVEARVIRLYPPRSAFDFAGELSAEVLVRLERNYPSGRGAV